MDNAVTGAGWLCVFTPETWSQAKSINYSQAALPILRAKAGFRMRPGNRIFAYVTKTKKIAAVLEVTGKADISIEESKFGAPGQFPVIIPTRALRIIEDGHWLDMESLVGRLRLFRGLSDKKYWSVAIRISPRELSAVDTQILDKLTSDLPCLQSIT
jgi:hypothetical protein